MPERESTRRELAAGTVSPAGMADRERAHLRRLDIGLALLSVSFAARKGLPTRLNGCRALAYTSEQIVAMLPANEDQ